MVEWPSSETERTFDQSAANGRKEPRVPDAACGTNGSFGRNPCGQHYEPLECKACRSVVTVNTRALDSRCPKCRSRRVRRLQPFQKVLKG